MVIQTFQRHIKTAMRRAARAAGLDSRSFIIDPVLDGKHVCAVTVRVGEVMRLYPVRETAEWARTLIDDAANGVFGAGLSNGTR